MLTVKGQQEIKPCQKEPAFIAHYGIDPLWSALSTSEKHKMGLVLVELIKTGTEAKPSPNSFRGRIFQDSSWKKAGWLSGICLDAAGNVYTIPAPLVSVLDNPPQNQNSIFRVDAQSGIMQKWLQLPLKKYESGNSPFGLMGISFDCTSGTLFAASIAGSKRFQEKGIIYAIEAVNKKLKDSLVGIDAIGLTLYFDPVGKKRLLFGKARTGEIWSVMVDKNARFLKKSLQKELSLEGLGPRGDDKARKIRFTNGILSINGIAFNYNLQASSEKPETVYDFKWNQVTKKWELVNLY
ncbi:MAG: hypothetical protein B7Y15_11695 [Bacteroidetes bacterium 24-39-8]|nr:MAG: hypothetical protein B7Y15_11695 [Bacteroidetes bacterium 24-39-8]OZA62283.1 MAG: hypothetical protein B7X72_12435 [Sphingobacteriia bacterium 39-39-8]HQS56073.1 hypothetical protein [Sediminibacterium sp.]